MGSGKSYAAVEHQIIPALKAGRTVVTNIPVYREKLLAYCGAGELVDLPLETVSSDPATIYDYCKPGTVVVIDEVWRIFPAGLKANHVPEPFRQLLAEHRHMVNTQGQSMQIVLVTQDLSQISAFARSLVESTFRSTKLTVIGANGRFRVDVYQGAVTGQNPNPQNRVREIYGRYKPEIYSLYKSHTMSESDSDGADESTVDNRGQAWRKPIILIGLVGGPLMLAGGIWYAVKGLDPTDQNSVFYHEPSQVQETEGPYQVTAARQIPPSMFQPTSAQTNPWRLAGVVHLSGNGKAVFTDGVKYRYLDYGTSCSARQTGTFCLLDGVTYPLLEQWPNGTSGFGAVSVATSAPKRLTDSDTIN